MSTITTANGSVFDMAFGGPVSITENIVFLVKIINSDMDTVHNTFKEPENTEALTISLNDSDPGETYYGYTRYCGFDKDVDGSITVTLKKNLGT